MWLGLLGIAELVALILVLGTPLPWWIAAFSVPLGLWLVARVVDATLHPRGLLPGSRRWERAHRELMVSEAPFDLYAIPPERWDGVCSLGGSGRRNGVVSHVDFAYLEQVPPSGERPRRGIEVANLAPDHSRGHRHAHLDHVVNFMSRFTELTWHPITGADPGPRTVRPPLQVEVAGIPRGVESVGFMDHPELEMLHVPLPAVDVLLLGWGLDPGRLAELAGHLEVLAPESDLQRRMQAAAAEARAGFEALQTKEHPS